MLDVENIQVFYGKIHALKGISISVEKGEIVALLASSRVVKISRLSSSSRILPLKDSMYGAVAELDPLGS